MDFHQWRGLLQRMLDHIGEGDLSAPEENDVRRWHEAGLSPKQALDRLIDERIEAGE